MRKKHLPAFLFLLFVGNSFTYTSDVPGQLSALSAMYGLSVAHESIARPSATLSDEMAEALQKIQENTYDYVVMQDYGGRAITDIEAFNRDIKTLCDAATVPDGANIKI